jgi:hypothetical protein
MRTGGDLGIGDHQTTVRIVDDERAKDSDIQIDRARRIPIGGAFPPQLLLQRAEHSILQVPR